MNLAEEPGKSNETACIIYGGHGSLSVIENRKLMNMERTETCYSVVQKNIYH